MLRHSRRHPRRIEQIQVRPGSVPKQALSGPQKPREVLAAVTETIHRQLLFQGLLRGSAAAVASPRHLAGDDVQADTAAASLRTMAARPSSGSTRISAAASGRVCGTTPKMLLVAGLEVAERLFFALPSSSLAGGCAAFSGRGGSGAAQRTELRVGQDAAICHRRPRDRCQFPSEMPARILALSQPARCGACAWQSAAQSSAWRAGSSASSVHRSLNLALDGGAGAVCRWDCPILTLPHR